MIGTPESPATSPEAPVAPKKRGGGPQSPEGRARSRQNSLKHGLTSKILLPKDLAGAVARRTEEFLADFQPRTPYQAFLVREMALAAVRLDRCAEISIANDRRVVHRAEVIWDHDRRTAVEDLGARLSKDPARVAPRLRGRKQGADWLIERWEALGEILRNKGAWTDGQRRLAFDLLGVPAELRDGGGILPPADDAEALAELVEEQVAILHEDRKLVLEALDAEERSMALEGMPAEEDATSARLRKYEASCRRAFHAAKAELLRLREAEAAAEAGPPPSPKAPLSGAAIDNLVKRSRIAMQMGAEDRSAQAGAPAPAPAPVAERPAVAEAPKAPAAVAPVPTRSSMVPASALNRRERRAQAKRERQAARRAASGR